MGADDEEGGVAGEVIGGMGLRTLLALQHDRTTARDCSVAELVPFQAAPNETSNSPHRRYATAVTRRYGSRASAHLA